jgi:hypothetical protein
MEQADSAETPSQQPCLERDAASVDDDASTARPPQAVQSKDDDDGGALHANPTSVTPSNSTRSHPIGLSKRSARRLQQAPTPTNQRLHQDHQARAPNLSARRPNLGRLPPVLHSLPPHWPPSLNHFHRRRRRRRHQFGLRRVRLDRGRRASPLRRGPKRRPLGRGIRPRTEISPPNRTSSPDHPSWCRPRRPRLRLPR